MYYAVGRPMSLVAQLKRWLLGSNLPNEYVCLKANSLPDAPRPMLVLGDARIDVTDDHFVLGYKPLLMGVSSPRAYEVSEGAQNATLELITGSGHVVARLDLVQVRRTRFGDDTLLIFEGRYGQHEFLSRARQAINRVYESTRAKPAGNIGLEGNLYHQVRIGYAHPRVIAVHRLVHPEEPAALAHVHRYYAQWRADRGLSTPWLFR
jgi:hypothetical protein